MFFWIVFPGSWPAGWTRILRTRFHSRVLRGPRYPARVVRTRFQSRVQADLPEVTDYWRMPWSRVARERRHGGVARSGIGPDCPTHRKRRRRVRAVRPAVPIGRGAVLARLTPTTAPLLPTRDALFRVEGFVHARRA